MKYIKAQCKEVLKLQCLNCHNNVYTCDGCKEYFGEGSIVYCFNDSRHLCEDCLPSEDKV